MRPNLFETDFGRGKRPYAAEVRSLRLEPFVLARFAHGTLSQDQSPDLRFDQPPDHQPETKERIRMLYDSTRNLLVSILGSLGSGDDNRWEDQTESGNALLYEMHQMSGSLSSPYRPDKRSKATSFSESQSSVAGKLTRAIPHVKEMVIAIRHKDQIQALDNGRGENTRNGHNTGFSGLTRPGSDSRGLPLGGEK